MREFVDLPGASGATYRFRLLARGETPLRIAGNVAILRSRAEGYSMLHLGMTDDLSTMREQAPPIEVHGPFGYYIRLNVSRLAREAEHADIAAAHQLADASAAE